MPDDTNTPPEPPVPPVPPVPPTPETPAAKPKPQKQHPSIKPPETAKADEDPPETPAAKPKPQKRNADGFVPGQQLTHDQILQLKRKPAPAKEEE